MYIFCLGKVNVDWRSKENLPIHKFKKKDIKHQLIELIYIVKKKQKKLDNKLFFDSLSLTTYLFKVLQLMQLFPLIWLKKNPCLIQIDGCTIALHFLSSTMI